MMRFLPFLLFVHLSLAGAAQQKPHDYAYAVRLVGADGRTSTWLDSVQALAQKEGNYNLLEVLTLNRIAYQAGVQKAIDSLVPLRLTERLESYQRQDEKYLRLHAMILLSDAQWNAKRYDRALELALRAYDEYRNLPGGKFPLKYFALTQLAGRFYYFRDFANARIYLREALATTDAVNIPSRFVVQNTLALCYRHQGYYDTAGQLFREALPAAMAAGNDIWVNITKGNLGITYYYQHRYDEAIPLLEADIASSLYKANEPENGVNSQAYLAAVYLDQGKAAMAAPVLAAAEAIVRRTGLFHDPQKAAHFQTQLARLADAQGRASDAARSWRAAADARDTLFRRSNALVLAGAQLRVNADAYRSNLILLEQQGKLQRWLRNSLLAGIVLLAIIGILVIQRLRLRQERARAEIKAGAEQLEEFTRALHEKNNLIERFRSELLHLSPGSLQAMEGPSAITELRALTILTEDEWTHFRGLFEKVHAGFFQRLDQKLPGLTAGDIRYVTLTKLQFSNKEIGSMLGINAASVRVTRSRLRKKLGLAEDDSLEAVIATI